MRKYNFSGKGSAQTQSAVAPIYTKKEEKKNTGGVLGGLGYLGEKVAAGFLQSTEGIVDYTVGGLAKLFGADAFAEDVFENDWFGDWYTSAGDWYNANGIMKTAGDVAGGIGTSLPSIAATAGAAIVTSASGGTLSPLAAGIISAATAGLGAAGTSTKEAYRESGELTGKELLYGGLSGAVEGGTEALTNAVSLGSGAVIKNITKSIGKEVTETVARKSVVKSLAGAFAGEAFEEGFSEWINPYIARITYDADAENATASEIGYAALIGGLSGMVMQGGSMTIDTATSLSRGADITAKGQEGDVLTLSARLAQFEDANKTGNEAFEAVAETYKRLSESLAKTGGKATTVTQKKMIGDLSRANVAAVFSPMITKSAANIYENAETIAAALDTYGYTDENGNPIRYTADEIRAGITPGDAKSFARALKENTVLRTLAAADVTGHLVQDTKKFKDAVLRGEQIASRADLWRFAETATGEEIRAVSEALGIDNWETLTEDEFRAKTAEFIASGRADELTEGRREAEMIFADESKAAPMPKTVTLADGQTRRYVAQDGDIAISRKGESYRIYDYVTRTKSREMSRAEINKALADENARQESITREAREHADRAAEIKRNTEEIDTWARENVKDYKNISSTNQTMVRHVIRSARAHGFSEADVKMYADVSAHAGIDITFSKKLCRVDGGYADGFWDPAKNRIVVNPEGTRSAESLLLHELDHAVRSGIRKDGGTETFADAVFGISTEDAQKITARYKNVESDVSKTELIFDEANAYFAETFFANKGVLESLTAKVPSIKERILAFLEGAKTDYKGAPKLEGAAARYYKQYKRMFDEFAARNAGRNAQEAAGGASPSPTEEKKYALPEDIAEILFDEDFYAQFAGESKEKISETVAELEAIKNSEAFETMDYDEKFDINAKLKALEAGYTTLYDYYVGKRKASITEEYERYLKTGRENSISRKLKEKQAAKAKAEMLSAEKAEATPHKNAQFAIIQQTNPMYDEFHTGIRSPADIKTFEETLEDSDSFNWGDFTREDAQAALEAGKVRIYSSYAIKNGVFVSTSYKQALDYASGNAKSVHSRTVALDSVAWINGDEGQYARVVKGKSDGRRFALPFDDKARKEVDKLLESEGIKPASVLDRFVPTADGSKRIARYSRADAMKTISKLPHIDAMSDAKYKQMIAAMYDGMEKARTMDAKIDFARGFAKAFAEDLTEAREVRADHAEAIETAQKLGFGLQKLTFSKEDINELMHLLGEKDARAFMKRWGRKKTDVKYPIDVFLRDVQTAAPEFTEAIDGKAPVDALAEIDRIYRDAKERARSKYVYPYAQMTDTEREMLEDKVFKGIMEGFAAADAEITGQAMKSAADEATYFQAKLEEQTATDRDFREALQADFDRRAGNLAERERATKEYYGTQTKMAKIAQKGAEATAREAKKEAERAKKAEAKANERAKKAEARAEKEIEAEEARAERVTEAYEKKAERAEERAKKAEDAYREMRGGERYRAYISARVDKLREMKSGTYHNTAFLKDDTFDKIIARLISIEWRKDFSTDGTKRAFKDLLKWYDPTNEIIGTSFDADLQAQIADIAVTEKKAYSADDLKAIDEILGYFTKFIEHFRKVYIGGKWVDTKSVAEAYVEKLHSGKKIKEGWFRDWNRRYLGAFGDVASVVRYYDRYQKDGFFTDTFTQMREAAIKADAEQMRLMRSYEAFMKENPKYLAEAEKSEIEFAGVKMPKMTAISLLMTMNREQARKGFAVGGFKFTDAKGKAVRVDGFALGTEISSDTDMQALEFEKLVTGRRTELERLMTDTDRAYMKVLEKVYNEDARNLKAERDQDKFGFTNVLDDYYYPIRRANTAKSVDTSFSAELDRVSNASFNKDIVKGAAGELFIQNADVLFRNHVRAVCQYSALSPVIETYDRIYSFDISENPNRPVSVKTESENVWAEGDAYFRDLFGDMQGIPRTRGAGNKLLTSIRGGYAKYQLGANPKTWASQLSSLFASTSIIDFRSIAASSVISGKDVDKYCTVAELRNADNTAAMAQGVLTRGERVKRKIDTVSDALMKPIGWVDRGVVRRLFAACQAEVQRKGGAKVGTEQNKVEAGKLLEKVILETQQNSFATERSAAMRGPSEILKTFTMFSADGMKMVGRVIDGFGEVSAIKAQMKGADKATRSALDAELKKASKKLGKSIGAMVTSSIYMAFVAQLFRHLFDKEEDDDTVLAVAWSMALDFGGGMTGGLPLWRDVYTRITDGFGVENCTISTFNDLMDSTAGILSFTTKAMQGETKQQEINRAVKNLVYTACQFGGIPTRNVMNTVEGITKKFSPESVYTVDSWFYEKNYKNDLARAVRKGDERMTNMLLSLATKEIVGDPWSEGVHTEMLRLTAAGYRTLPKEVGNTLTVDGTEYAMTDEEREMVREAYEKRLDGLEKLFDAGAYKGMSDEEKTDAIKAYYTAAYNAALSEVYGIDRGNAARITDVIGTEVMALYSVKTKGITSDTDKNGKTIAGTKRKKTIAAINALGVSTEKKLLLICSKGYTLQDGDVRGLSATAAKKRLLKFILALPGKTKNEKAELAAMCGFAVENGKISLKNTA